jgi:hypothetical protein
MNTIYSASRAQAIAAGLQIDATESAREAGIKLPVFVTSDARAKCGDRFQIMLWMLRYTIRKAESGATLLRFEMYVKNGRKANLVKLYASVNAMDIDDPRPAITVMLPEEV